MKKDRIKYFEDNGIDFKQFENSAYGERTEFFQHTIICSIPKGTDKKVVTEYVKELLNDKGYISFEYVVSKPKSHYSRDYREDRFTFDEIVGTDIKDILAENLKSEIGFMGSISG